MTRLALIHIFSNLDTSPITALEGALEARAHEQFLE